MKKSKLPSIVITSLVGVGVLGLGLTVYENKKDIHDTLNSTIEVNPQNQFNMRIQGEITPIKELTLGTIQMRKVNSQVDRLAFQNKIKDADIAIDRAITNINNLKVSPNQQLAKESTVIALNKLKYTLGLLNSASQKEDFKVNGNETVDNIFRDLSNCYEQIDDAVGLAEGVR